MLFDEEKVINLLIALSNLVALCPSDLKLEEYRQTCNKNCYICWRNAVDIENKELEESEEIIETLPQREINIGELYNYIEKTGYPVDYTITEWIYKSLQKINMQRNDTQVILIYNKEYKKIEVRVNQVNIIFTFIHK